MIVNDITYLCKGKIIIENRNNWIFYIDDIKNNIPFDIAIKQVIGFYAATDGNLMITVNE